MRSKVALIRGVLVVCGCAIFATANPAAAQDNTPVPTNAFITQNGLDWAWANPLPGSESMLTYQSQFGWRFPTAIELATAPLATDFLFAGANVPFGGTDPATGAYFSATNAVYTAAQSAGACATPYFSATYNHCDWQDGNGQPYQPWAGTPGALSFADQLFVRVAAVGAIPEPSTWAMLLIGFASVGGAMRARRRQSLKVSYS